MNKPIKTIFLSTITLSLVACSTTAVTPTAMEMNDTLAEITGMDGKACLRIRDITGYTALSETVISARMLRRSQALLVTNKRCPGLQSTNAAIFDSTVTEICGGRTDSLITFRERCTVKSIFEFENQQAAFDAFEQAETRIREK